MIVVVRAKDDLLLLFNTLSPNSQSKFSAFPGLPDRGHAGIRVSSGEILSKGHMWRDGAQVEKNRREWRELQRSSQDWNPERWGEGMTLQHSRKENGKSTLTLEEPGSFGDGTWLLFSLFISSPDGASPASWLGKPRGKGLHQCRGCRSAF